jgi:hypothetical protein
MIESRNVSAAWVIMILAVIVATIPILQPLPKFKIEELNMHTNLFLLITVGSRVVYWVLLGFIFYWGLGFAKDNTLLLHQKNKEDEANKERQALRVAATAKTEDPYETKLKAFIQDGISLAKRLRDEIPLETNNESDRKKIQEKLDKTLLQWLDEKEKSIKPQT